MARSAKGIALSQRKYTLDLLSDVGMLGCRAASTPIDPNHKVTAQSGEPVDKERYQRLVGRLLYLCHTRPDIAFAVSVVSRYMHEPRSDHLEAVNRILRYLKGTPGRGLLFESNKHLVIDGYCDADWASCLDDRRSTSGFCVFVGGNLVSWRSKKQAVVSRSTAEAEYRAMAQGLSDMLWTRNLLEELKILKTSCVNVWCDNKSAMRKRKQVDSTAATSPLKEAAEEEKDSSGSSSEPKELADPLVVTPLDSAPPAGFGRMPSPSMSSDGEDVDR